MTSPVFHIRPAAPGDEDQLAEVHVRAWREAYTGRMPQELLDGLSVPDRVASWKRILADEGQTDARWRSWVAVDQDERLIGFVSIGPCRDEGAAERTELYALYLLARAHGSGAGQALFDAASAHSRPTSLWVLDDNPRAQAFYRRNGFAFDGAAKQEEFRGTPVPERRMSRP